MHSRHLAVCGAIALVATLTSGLFAMPIGLRLAMMSETGPTIDLAHNYAFSAGVVTEGRYAGWTWAEMEDYAEHFHGVGSGSPWEFEYGDDQLDNVCIPVTGCGKEKIVPVITLGTATAADGLSATVWTDAELAAKLHVGEYEFEEDYGEFYYEDEVRKLSYEFPVSVWPDGRIVEGRQWIIVSLKNVRIGKDGFFDSKTFTVGIEGTDLTTPTITLRPDDELPVTTQFTPSNVFGLGIKMNGLSVLDADCGYSFDPFFGLWDGVGVSGAGQIPHRFDFDDEVEEERNITVSVPSAGELYLKIENNYDSGGSSWDLSLATLQFSGSAYSGSVRTVGSAQRWSGKSYWVVVGAKSAGDLTIGLGDFEKLIVNGIWFRPSTVAETQCLATEAWYREEVTVANDIRMADYRGFVTGLGLVKFGDKASLVCHPNEGEMLERWEFLNCTAPADATVNSTNLKFTVTQALYDQIAASSDNPIKRVIVRPVFKTVAYGPFEMGLGCYGNFEGDWHELEGKGNFLLGGGEYVFIPVTGDGEISPVILHGDTTDECFESVEVWSEEKMFATYVPSGVPQSEWDRWEEYGDLWYEYESDDDDGISYCWPSYLWPENKPVPGRRWIVVKSSEASYSGALKTFRVGIDGTSVISDTLLLRPEGFRFEELDGFVHGIGLSGVDFVMFGSNYSGPGGSLQSGLIMPKWKILNTAFPEGKAMSFTVDLPSAGTLVIPAFDNEDSLARSSLFSVSGKNITSDVYTDYGWLGGDTWKASYADGTRRIKVSGATMLTFTQNEIEDCDGGFMRMYFFPEGQKSVAVEAAYMCYRDDDLGYWYPKQHAEGVVTGSGVYKSGETVTLKAVPYNGAEFDHWEVRYGNLTLSNVQLISPEISFAVTDAMCGNMSDEAQIFISAFWKPRHAIMGMPAVVGTGTVTGSGRYVAGASVTLNAVAAPGYEFVTWSDGLPESERTVVTTDEDQILYAYFGMAQNCPVKDVLDGTWTTGEDGEALAEGCVDSTVAGGMSVRFTATDEASAWVETVVTNACRVSFDWKSSCEPLVKGRPFDYLAFTVDGVRKDFICDETDWTNVTFLVTGGGEHVLRWTFTRDEDGSSGEDCAWLANVEVTPSVTLTFANGGATAGAAPEPIAVYADESVVLPDQGSLAWPKHTFLGWSDSETLYEPGMEYIIVSNAVFVALWRRNELSAPVITASETYEADSTTVAIAADEGATIFYTLDGTDPKAARSESAPYQWIPATPSTIQYQMAFEVEGSATVKAIAVSDDYFDSNVATATVTRLTWTFGEYLNWPGQPFTTGDNAAWTRVKGVSVDGYALRSGAITHSQTSRLETVVFGPGTITFSCKVAGEIVKKVVWDGLAFCIDGVQQGDLMGNAEWAEKSFEVAGAGPHTLSWLYVKDEEGTEGEDCSWLDCVTWIPAPDPIPTVAADAAPSAVTNAIEEAGFADAAEVKRAIGGSAEKYAAFKEWAQSVKHPGGSPSSATVAGEAAVVANTNAAAAFMLGAERLFEKAPKIEFGDVAVATSATLPEGVGQGTAHPAEVTVSVVVKDGAEAVKCAAEKVKEMFEATSDLGDWNGSSKMTPTVTVENGEGATMRFRVTSGDGTATRAFLRIRK